MQQFDVSIHHIAGPQNCIADWISRSTLPETVEESADLDRMSLPLPTTLSPAYLRPQPAPGTSASAIRVSAPFPRRSPKSQRSPLRGATPLRPTNTPMASAAIDTRTSSSFLPSTETS